MPWVGLGLLDARGDSLDKPPNIFICDACVLIRERTFEHDKVLDRSTNHPILVRRDQFESRGRDSHNTSWSLRLVPFMRSCFNGQTGFGMSSLTSFLTSFVSRLVATNHPASIPASINALRDEIRRLLVLSAVRGSENRTRNFGHWSRSQYREYSGFINSLPLEKQLDSNYHLQSKNRYR